MGSVDYAPDPVTETAFGFKWGPMEITRLAAVPTYHDADSFYRFLGVRVGDKMIEVSVSDKGRTVKVFIDGSEVEAK